MLLAFVRTAIVFLCLVLAVMLNLKMTTDGAGVNAMGPIG